jgi:hypothetical protein
MSTDESTKGMITRKQGESINNKEKIPLQQRLQSKNYIRTPKYASKRLEYRK